MPSQASAWCMASGPSFDFRGILQPRALILQTYDRVRDCLDEEELDVFRIQFKTGRQVCCFRSCTPTCPRYWCCLCAICLADRERGYIRDLDPPFRRTLCSPSKFFASFHSSTVAHSCGMQLHRQDEGPAVRLLRPGRPTAPRNLRTRQSGRRRAAGGARRPQRPAFWPPGDATVHRGDAAGRVRRRRQRHQRRGARCVATARCFA